MLKKWVFMIESNKNQEPTETQKKTARILSWVFGLVFLFATFGSFKAHDYLPATLCGLLIACLLLPPIRALFHRMTGLRISYELRTALFLGLFFLSWYLSLTHIKFKVVKPSDSSGATVQSITAPPPPTSSK